MAINDIITRDILTDLRSFYSYWEKEDKTEGRISWLELKSLSEGFITVGTDADYSTIQLALADGHYNLFLISDVTETVNWGSHTSKVINLVSDQERTINLSISNTSALNIVASNINFAVTGTNQIFDENSKIYLTNCTITGDASINKFNIQIASNKGYIYAKNLTINTGNASIYISVENGNEISLIGGGLSCHLGLGGVDAVLTNITATGTFGVFLAGSARNAIYLGGESTIRNVKNSAANFRIRVETNSLVDSVECYYLEVAGSLSNITIENSSITGAIYGYPGITNKIKSISNTIIRNSIEQGFLDGDVHFIKYVENCYFNFVPNFTNEIDIQNCDFVGNVTISGDNINLNSSRILAGTITVDATADLTNILECRTLTDVVNNGTNTKIFMHDPKVSDNYPNLGTLPVTVGTGGDYATVQLALVAEKYNIELISDVTEIVDWGIHPYITIQISGGSEMKDISLSVSNSCSGRIIAHNINFVLEGTLEIFTSNSLKLFLDDCKIKGNSDNNNFGGGVLIDASNLTISTGTGYFQLRYLRNVDYLELIGENNLTAVNNIRSTIGVIKHVKTSGTFGTNLINDHFLVVYGSTINFIEIGHSSSSSIKLYKNATINGNSGLLEVRMGESGFRLYNCICNNFYFQTGSADDSIIENCSVVTIAFGLFKGVFKSFKNNIIQDDVVIDYDGNIVSNCTFDGLSVSADNVKIENTKVPNSTIIIDTTADKTLITGCRTLSSIVDNGTNTQLIGNFLI